MRKAHFIIILFVPYLFFACNDDKKQIEVKDLMLEQTILDTPPPPPPPVTNHSNINNRDSIPNKISLMHFKNVPKELHGCGCYFSETKEKFNVKEYLFAADYDSVAVISVNNTLVKLRLVSSTRKAGTFADSDHIEIYSNNLYKVTVDIKYKHTIASEVWWNDGTMTIESKNGQKIVKKMVGECGC